MARPKIECEKELPKELPVNLVPWLWKSLKRVADDMHLNLPDNLNNAEKAFIRKFKTDWYKIALWIMADAEPNIHTGFRPYNRPDFVHAKYDAKIFYQWLNISKALFDIYPKELEQIYGSPTNFWCILLIEYKQQQLSAFFETKPISLHETNDSRKKILSLLKTFSSGEEVMLNSKMKTRFAKKCANEAEIKSDLRKALLNPLEYIDVPLDLLDIPLKVDTSINTLPFHRALFYRKIYEICNLDFSKSSKNIAKAKEFKNIIWEQYLQAEEARLNYYSSPRPKIAKAIFEEKNALYFLEPSERGRPKKVIVKK